jgi:hypothetical protein
MAKKSPGHHSRVMQYWDDVIGDMERTAEEYEEQGWKSITLYVGDVTTIVETDEPNLDILVPDNQFGGVETLVENTEGSFETYDVYRQGRGDLIFLVVVAKNPTAGVAIFIPSYYSTNSDKDFVRTAREQNVIRTHLRSLSDESSISFEHEDVVPFLPDK